ncbi:diflavin oxidoreductase [Methylobacillus pratensis]
MTILKTRPEIFKEEHWQEVVDLTNRLDEKQCIWLSGYLAGRVNMQPLTAHAAQAETLDEIVVCHGGETGNSKKIALQAEKKLSALGYRNKVLDLAEVTLRQFAKLRMAVIICSTHGDGDPPEPIAAFYHSLMSSRLPLDAMRYAVLALGDSSYEHFCVTGINIDEKLRQSGASSLLERQNCDTDFQKTADAWLDALIAKLPAPDGAQAHADMPEAVRPAVKEIDKHYPVTVSIAENINLSAKGRRDAVHHLVCELGEHTLPLVAGDAVGIWVKNPAEMVEELLQATHLNGEQTVSVEGVSLSLAQALRDKLDITVPSRDFGQLWESLDTSGMFHAAMGDTEKSKKDFLKSKPLLELVKQFRVTVNAQQLVDVLRPLQPRLYDVANSLKQSPEELHLCVRKYLYTKEDSLYPGVGSHYLADLNAGDALAVFPHRHQRFHMPENREAPLILVADSTGIAPFIAFLQEMEAEQKPHECWLVFSERSFEDDFLYQSVLLKFLASGTLKCLHPVFYGDTTDDVIFDAIVQHESRFRDWLSRGGHLYFSGDKPLMTKTEESLKAWFKSREDGAWESLAAEKRLHKNLY